MNRCQHPQVAIKHATLEKIGRCGGRPCQNVGDREILDPSETAEQTNMWV